MHSSIASDSHLSPVDKVRHLVIYGLLTGLILICFHNGTTGSFMFDDNPSVVKNQTIHNTSLLEILKSQRDSATSARPLTNLSFAIDYKLYGLNPKPYLWTNIGIQILISWALFALLLRL
ncbi:MAG: hypothetical protein JKX85_09445, partial [Phycisphaeraceae bacterium]|nr:hypothetical protein [Phycisphaeraceae bacterium]